MCYHDLLKFTTLTEYLRDMLTFREKARPMIKIEVNDKKDSANIAKKFDIAERHVSKIEDQNLLDMVRWPYNVDPSDRWSLGPKQIRLL